GAGATVWGVSAAGNVPLARPVWQPAPGGTSRPGHATSPDPQPGVPRSPAAAGAGPQPAPLPPRVRTAPPSRGGDPSSRRLATLPGCSRGPLDRNCSAESPRVTMARVVPTGGSGPDFRPAGGNMAFSLGGHGMGNGGAGAGA